ncbi:hypothetical protein B0H14DRAFT_1003255 [Mycena olivaceomarginata]|nr:hypothetical protein B0H14DRAFT_1003255 [Mycena olivaceomarginata]
MDFPLALITGTLLSLVLVYWITRSSASKTPQIPGPPPHPFVGHTLQVPTVKTWKYFEKLYHEYGSIVKLTLAGDDIIVLSDPSDAEELESLADAVPRPSSLKANYSWVAVHTTTHPEDHSCTRVNISRKTNAWCFYPTAKF